jgi:hypothetical protein
MVNHGPERKRSIRQLLLSGMLKIVDVPKVLYNQNNSGLETITYLGPIILMLG